MYAPSDELTRIIKAGWESIVSHPKHDLNLGYRQAVWKALGWNSYKNEYDKRLGHRRRTKLAEMTAQKVLPIWYRQWDDDFPEKVLRERDGFLRGEITQKATRKSLVRFWDYLDGLDSRSEYAYTVFTDAGRAVLGMLEVQVYDERFDPDDIDFRIVDSEDYSDNDATYFAASAYANGRNWNSDAQPGSIRQKRREFWEWWLREAVPAAWETVLPPEGNE